MNDQYNAWSEQHLKEKSYSREPAKYTHGIQKSPPTSEDMKAYPIPGYPVSTKYGTKTQYDFKWKMLKDRKDLV